MKRFSVLSVSVLLVVGFTGLSQEVDSSGARPASGSINSIIPVSEVEWGPLNPARGDKSPRAGTLWGDRQSTQPTGFLVRFVDGFSSPPHIHNVTYRAVVISGLIHNDDPDAAHMWMPPGSFWTQPQGEVHITAARGESNIALVEIDRGPYLVRPPDQAYDSGERPVNVDVSNIVWVDFHSLSASSDGPSIAYLWGDLADGQHNGAFIRLPAGYGGDLRSHGDILRAVVIKGRLGYGSAEVKTLDPGSYFSSEGEFVHRVSSGKEEVVLYVRTTGGYELSSSVR